MCWMQRFYCYRLGLTMVQPPPFTQVGAAAIDGEGAGEAERRRAADELDDAWMLRQAEVASSLRALRQHTQLASGKYDMSSSLLKRAKAMLNALASECSKRGNNGSRDGLLKLVELSPSACFGQGLSDDGPQ